MDEPASPVSASASDMPGSAPASPAASVAQASDAVLDARKKKTRKKRKAVPGEDAAVDDSSQRERVKPGPKKKKRKEGKPKDADDGASRKKARKQVRKAQIVGIGAVEELSAAQLAANEQMRKVLEEDKYSALGSIVDTDSEDEDTTYRGRGGRLDRSNILAATRKRLWMERMSASGSAVVSSQDDENEGENDDAAARSSRPGRKKKKRRGRRSKEEEASAITGGAGSDHEVDGTEEVTSEIMSVDEPRELDVDRDEVSIFGATTGSSNATWVECDKCKKWRRLRGVVDEKKLPSKWYCSMNKNDPERSRCSAPEEEYETPNTPESAADARTRKHLRIWVRRLQCNEAYEARQPTMTRGKKRSAMTSSKEPYEWVRCCNPSCGKWRAILRCMDAKTHVLDRTTNGVWYCVMNTWDEKIASCAAPQENLPAIGCPPWVMQDEN